MISCRGLSASNRKIFTQLIQIRGGVCSTSTVKLQDAPLTDHMILFQIAALVENRSSSLGATMTLVLASHCCVQMSIARKETACVQASLLQRRR
jgi:hypothetical protein